jgi:VIT1/CCC1 family predicted Fe2+/Mn2+ transporter
MLCATWPGQPRQNWLACCVGGRLSATNVSELQTQYNDRVTRRFQIILSQPASRRLDGAPLGFWARFKLLFAGIATIVSVVVVLVAAFILGYILAAILCVVVLIAIVALMIKAELRRARQ